MGKVNKRSWLVRNSAAPGARHEGVEGSEDEPLDGVSAG